MTHGSLTKRTHFWRISQGDWSVTIKWQCELTSNHFGPDHVVLSVVFHDVTRFSFHCCHFLEDVFCTPRTNDLRVYFQTLCPHGRFQHHAYLEEHNTWHHQPTNIRVWQDAIDLTDGRGGQIYFHYTTEVSFQQITSQLESMEHVDILDAWEDVFLKASFCWCISCGVGGYNSFKLHSAVLDGSTEPTYVYRDWMYCCTSNMSYIHKASCLDAKHPRNHWHLTLMALKSWLYCCLQMNGKINSNCWTSSVAKIW